MSNYQMPKPGSLWRFENGPSEFTAERYYEKGTRNRATLELVVKTWVEAVLTTHVEKGATYKQGVVVMPIAAMTIPLPDYKIDELWAVRFLCEDQMNDIVILDSNWHLWFTKVS